MLVTPRARIRSDYRCGTCGYGVVALDPPQESTFYPTNVNPNRLVVGTNLLAVEVHQSGTNSADLGFEFALDTNTGTVLPASPDPLVRRHSETGG